jgi:hypothetical protein
LAAPPGSRAVRPVLTPGDLLAGRYRLVRPVDAATPGEAGPAVLWEARDEVLARPVACKVLSAGGRRGAAAARPFLQAASEAGALSSPVLARVYDAAIEQRPAERSGRPAGEIDIAYVISEWVDGRRLTQVLEQDGPYAPGAAVALATALAEALSAAHARGVTHGRLHPGNVLLTRNGVPKLTDLAVSASLPDRAVPAARADDPAPAAQDVRDLAAVLYALLTARWPQGATPQPSGGVPDAPGQRAASDKRARTSSPRQVRAGVPRALDGVVVRALDPAKAAVPPRVDTATGLSDALEAAVRADAPPRPAPAVQRAPRVPRWVLRRLPVVGVLAVLVGIGFGAYAIGRTIGEVPTPDDQAEVLASPTPGPGAGQRVDIAGVPVRDFDPAGGDGERPGSVPNAHDGDASTVWTTERYDTVDFGGFKEGVGLLVDLGAAVPVTRVELTVPVPGISVELRAAAQASDELAGYRVLTRGRATGTRLALAPPAGTRDRYYLVWITGLVPDRDKFAASIAELAFTRAPA